MTRINFNKLKIATCTLVLLVSLSNIKAQSSTSPYAMFGLGSFSNNADSRATGMGGASLALPSVNSPSASNPASIVHLDSLLFHMNLEMHADASRYSNKYKIENLYDSNFDQLQFAFKAAKWWGTGFGISSIAQSNYNISTEKYILGTVSKYNVNYQSNGGLSKVYWTNAFNPFKGLAIGANISLVWGSINSNEISTFSNINGETISNEKTYHLYNFLWDAGAQYQYKLGKTQFMFGATYQPKISLLTDFSQTITGNSVYYSDEQAATNYELPESYGAGIAISFNNTLTFASDYKFQNWSNAANPIRYATLNDAYIVNGGIEYTPQKNRYRNIFNRMTYRAGAFMGDTYLTINGVTIKQKGLTAGLGIPLRQNKNYINLSYQFANIGTQSSGLIAETNHSVKLSINFSENWFSKSKFY